MLLQEITDLMERCRSQGLLEEQIQQKDSIISELEQTISAAEVQLMPVPPRTTAVHHAFLCFLEHSMLP